MTDETQQSDSAEPAAKSGGLKLLVIMVASLLVGGAAGVFGIAPALGAKPAASEADAGGDHGKKGGHGKEDAPSFFPLDNLVVNPAGSQGTRFLVVSLAIRLSDRGTTEELVARDPEIRDALLGMLGQRTVEQLSDPTARDSLRVQIKATIESVIGEGKIASILMPQFVLQ